MKVLIVDDSKTARLFSKKCVEMVINNENIEFVEAKDGEEAFNKLKDGPVDFILCDINMPVMTGFTFIKNLITDTKLKNIPVVFVTSMANEARSQNLIQLGAKDVIQKPLRPNALMLVLQKMGMIKSNAENDGWGN